MLYIMFLVSLESSGWEGVDVLHHVLGVVGKLWMRRGRYAWFHDIWTCSAKVLEYWWFFHWKLNWIVAENLGGIGMYVPLVMLLERSWWWAGFDGVYSVRFGFRMWEILIFFNWFLLAENSNKFPKNQALEGKKSVEDMVTTLGPMAQATLLLLLLQKLK